MGLIAGIELVRDRESKQPFDAADQIGPRIFQRMLEKGVIIRSVGDVLAFCPPYVITKEELDTLLETTARPSTR